jgi:hypothetical protein
MNPNKPSVQWLFACRLPRTLADACIDINNPETFRQWANATQKHHCNWLHKRAIHGEYEQTQPRTDPSVRDRVPRCQSLPRRFFLPSPPKPTATGTSVTMKKVKVVETKESSATSPYQIAKILQAYNDDECDTFIKVMQEEDDKMGFSSCLGTMALIRACNSPDSVYVAKKKSIHTSLLLHTGSKRAMKKALLNTGATENFIHPRVVKQLSLKTKKLSKPRKVKNMDGTLNQSREITDAVTLIVMYNGKPMRHLFFVANIASDDLILGYPFFEDANPSVLWKEGRLKGTLMLATVQKPEEYRDTIPLWLWKATTATQLAAEEAAKKKKQTWDEIVPKHYHRYGHIFQEEASECFPTPRKWDHAINLKEDAPSSIDCRIYPLSPKEKEAQHTFIEENLCLKWIH